MRARDKNDKTEKGAVGEIISCSFSVEENELAAKYVRLEEHRRGGDRCGWPTI